MVKTRFQVPYGLIISAVVCFVLGLAAGPLIRSSATKEQLINNVLLSAIPFILIFVSILLTFITGIVIVSRLLSNKIEGGLYRTVERIIIAGIVLGVIGMFQPWLMIFYKYGFMLLLISTLSFILWSHIRPKGIRRQHDVNSASLTEN